MNHMPTMPGSGPRGGVFERLSAPQREALLAHAQRLEVPRGEVLVAAGDPCQSFFVVLRGAFATASGDRRAGDMIGEAAFFGGDDHAASVTALRDGEVLEVSRASYDMLARSVPGLADTFLGLVARRLHGAEARPASRAAAPRRAVAIVAGGYGHVPPALFERLRARLARAGAVAVDRALLADRFGALAPDDPLVAEWLDRLEGEGRPVFYFGDPTLTDWTRTCIRQADEVVMAVSGDAPRGRLSPVELLVEALHPPQARRLVRLHPRRTGVVSGTAAWLARMEVFLHHHVSLEDDADLDAVVRFLTGRAVGFVGGGGGGQGSAHVGIHRALREHGADFDIFIGSSVGAAMLAGFAFLNEHEALTAGTHDIFVKSRGLKRPTWPRYSLLDHKVFDEALARAFGADTRVEDCWKPYFAIATNLSANRMEIIRSGLLWHAVRASTAVPCVLTPFFTEDGTMLVDGGIMDDAPLAPMKAIKTGPNLVVHFGGGGEQRFDLAYDELPGRGRLLASLLNPRARLPRAPRIMSMLFRTMLAHQRYELPLGPHDMVLSPPRFPGVSMISFDRHMDVFNAAHRWALQEIETRAQAGDEALAAVLGASAGGGAATVAASPAELAAA